MAKKKVLTPEELLQSGKEILQALVVSENTPETNRLDFVIEPQSITKCVSLLVQAKWGYLSAITALDRPEYSVVEGTNEKEASRDNGNVELLYHFCNGAAIITLRVLLPYAAARIDSICGVIPSATLYEREAMELLGVEFIGTPSTEKLLLPDDWPINVYPLRKSFTGLDKKNMVEEK